MPDLIQLTLSKDEFLYLFACSALGEAVMNYTATKIQEGIELVRENYTDLTPGGWAELTERMIQLGEPVFT